MNRFQERNIGCLQKENPTFKEELYSYRLSEEKKLKVDQLFKE